MSDALSFAEIDGQHVDLLPARTVLSGGGASGFGGPGGSGGDGGDALIVLGLNILNFGDYNVAGNTGAGAPGGEGGDAIGAVVS